MADHLAGPLTRIINGCLTEAYFPKLCKIARVSPIPKVDNPTTNDELRPISILPVLSKVFERLVGWQMSEFANSASLLHDNISSFRKGHSTTTALLGIRDDIKRAMKRKEVTLMVLADFSKAFDTVCFKTTLKKFYKLVFSKNYFKWLLGYSSDRTQFVQIDDTKSATPQIVTVWNTSRIDPRADDLQFVCIRPPRQPRSIHVLLSVRWWHIPLHPLCSKGIGINDVRFIRIPYQTWTMV